MFRGMEYVYEIYKERSFSKAADNLYISQPSLSASIKKIEARIGAPIFDRSTNPIQLTDCGKEYIRSVEKIMDIKTGFTNYLNDLQELRTGSLAIGASNFFSSFILPPIIAKYLEKYPQVKVNLVEANTPQLEKQLSSGLLDLILDNHIFNSSVFAKQFLLCEHLILAVPKRIAANKGADLYQLSSDDIIMGKHLDDNFPPIPLKIFDHDPFIFLKTGNDTRSRAEKICQQSNFSPMVILELDQMATSYNIACYGMGIAFINDTLVKMVKPDSNIQYYKIDSQYTKRDVYLYNKHNRYVTRAMEEFQKIATDT